MIAASSCCKEYQMVTSRSLRSSFHSAADNFNVGRRDVFFEVLHRGRSRNGQHHRRALQQPRQRELRDGGAVSLRRGIELAAGLRELSGCDREPRDEGDVVFGAVVDDVLVLTVAEVVLVLYAYDFDHLARLLDLVRLHFAEADVADLSLLLQSF